MKNIRSLISHLSNHIFFNKLITLEIGKRLFTIMYQAVKNN